MDSQGALVFGAYTADRPNYNPYGMAAFHPCAGSIVSVNES